MGGGGSDDDLSPARHSRRRSTFRTPQASLPWNEACILITDVSPLAGPSRTRPELQLETPGLGVTVPALPRMVFQTRRYVQYLSNFVAPSIYIYVPHAPFSVSLSVISGLKGSDYITLCVAVLVRVFAWWCQPSFWVLALRSPGKPWQARDPPTPAPYTQHGRVIPACFSCTLCLCLL